MNSEFLRYSYFNSLPSELILLILYQIENFEDILNFVESINTIKFVYLDNIAGVKRNIIIQGVPQIKDVLDDEYTLQEIGNLSIFLIRELIWFVQSNFALVDPTVEHWENISLNNYKIYDLVYRYRISVKFPVLYQKIKKLKFNKVIDQSNEIFDGYDYLEVPYWIKVYAILTEADLIDRELNVFIFKSGLPENYILNEKELTSETLYYSVFVYALITDPNFNPEIQSDKTLLLMIYRIYQLDTDIYRNFVRKISRDKKLKLLEEMRVIYFLLKTLNQEDNSSNNYNDMLIDFIQRI